MLRAGGALAALGATGVGGLSACSAARLSRNEDASEDFGAARLAAIMRNSFIEDLNEHNASANRTWESASNASTALILADDWRERYEATAQAGRGPDIAELFGNAPHLLDRQLVDLTDLVESIGEANGGWIPAARDAAMVDGRWRALPWAYTAQALNVRQDVLDDLGIASPSTYDDLLEASVRLRDAGAPPVGLSMSETAPNDSANLAYSMLWSFGGQEVDHGTGRVALDSNATRKALTHFVQLVEASYPAAIDFSELDNNTAFLAGDIALTQNASSIFWKARSDGNPIADAMGHLNFPAGPAGRHQLLELNSLALFDHSKNPDAARSWLRYMVEPNCLVTRAQISLSFFSPPLLGVLSGDNMPWHLHPELAGIEGSHEGGHMPGWPGPPSLESGLVYRNGSIVSMFRAVGKKTMSVEEAVGAATHELKRVYET